MSRSTQTVAEPVSGEGVRFWRILEAWWTAPAGGLSGRGGRAETRLGAFPSHSTPLPVWAWSPLSHLPHVTWRRDKGPWPPRPETPRPYLGCVQRAGTWRPEVHSACAALSPSICISHPSVFSSPFPLWFLPHFPHTKCTVFCGLITRKPPVKTRGLQGQSKRC